jgi:putative oxidoreductase
MDRTERLLVRIVRIALGLFMLGSGAAGLLHAVPPASTPRAAAFLTALAGAKYLLPLLSAIEVGAGALLLAGRLVPLALLALAPIMVNVLGYRLVLATPAMLPIVTALAAAQVFLAWMYRDSFAPLFAATRAQR